MLRHSKLQRNVLILYKNFLRLSENKPGINEYVKMEFRKNKEIAKSDVLRIEYLMRRGERQMQLLKNSAVQDMGFFKE